MIFLREVFSIVLLFAPAETETGHPLDSDVHLSSSNGDPTARAGPGLYPGETINAGGYALTFFAPFECTRLTPRLDTRVRSAIWSFHPAAEAGQNRNLLPLIKDALRLVTGYTGGAARAGHEIPRAIMMIGIRG